MEILNLRIKDQRVLEVMARTSREAFLPNTPRHVVYEDIPLPIGYGQTISQPLIVAMMIEALSLTGNESILEVGTGSGYQTALLAQLANEVVSVERIPELAVSAQMRFKLLKLKNVKILWASTREAYNYLQAKNCGCSIITMPSGIIEKISKFGKTYQELTLDTVKKFLEDSKNSNFKI